MLNDFTLKRGDGLTERKIRLVVVLKTNHAYHFRRMATDVSRLTVPKLPYAKPPQIKGSFTIVLNHGLQPYLDPMTQRNDLQDGFNGPTAEK
jgi:hypothetical protein